MALLESLHMGRTMLLNTTGEWVYAGPDCGGKTLNCWFSHLRPFPLAPSPKWAHSHYVTACGKPPDCCFDHRRKPAIRQPERARSRAPSVLGVASCVVYARLTRRTLFCQVRGRKPVLDPTHARGATGGFAAASSAPRPASPLPHLHWDSSVPVQDEPFEMNDAAQFIFKRKHLHMFNRCLTRNSARPSGPVSSLSFSLCSQSRYSHGAIGAESNRLHELFLA